jgi:hypothetical protein
MNVYEVSINTGHRTHVFIVVCDSPTGAFDVALRKFSDSYYLADSAVTKIECLHADVLVDRHA